MENSENKTEVFIHEIKLPENSDFSRRFNRVSDLWEHYSEEGITEEERKNRLDDFYSAKYCLEQGIG